MALPFEAFVAFRYLRSKRKEFFISVSTVLSVLSVTISVMVLNAVLSIMTGFEKELQSKLVDTSAHLIVREYGGSLLGWKSLSKAIQSSVEDVVSVVPYTYNQAMLTSKFGSSGLLLRGVSSDAAAISKLAKSASPEAIKALFQPQFVKLQRPDGIIDEVRLPGIILGKALSNKFNLRVGNFVTLLSPRMHSSPRGLTPRIKRFVVVGVYSSGLVEFEKGLAYIALDEARKFFELGNGVTGLEVQLKDMFKSEELIEPVAKSIEDQGGTYVITDWTAQNKPLWKALELEKTVYVLVLLLVVLIASFSIVSTLVMMVMEKRKDIAVLKSMGASRKNILRIYLLQGAVIGGGGTLFGTLSGYVFCEILDTVGFPIDPTVFAMSQVPVYISGINFLVVAISAFFITTCSGIYPAMRAAGIKPAEIFKYD